MTILWLFYAARSSGSINELTGSLKAVIKGTFVFFKNLLKKIKIGDGGNFF